MNPTPQQINRSRFIGRIVQSGCHVILVLGMLMAGRASAESKNQDAAVQQVLKKAQGVVRQLTEEKAQLETQKAALEAEKAAWNTEKAGLEKARADLQTSNASLQERVKKLEATLKPLQPLPAELQRCKTGIENLKTVKTRLETEVLEGRKREQSCQMRQEQEAALGLQIRQDNELLVEAVKEREKWITECGQRNGKLIEAGRQVVARYREKSFWDNAANLEPFTGIGKVARENAAEAFRYRIEHLKVTPFQGQVQAPAGGWDAVKTPAEPQGSTDSTPPEGARP